MTRLYQSILLKERVINLMMKNEEKNIVPEGMMSGPLQMSRRDV